VDRGVDDKEDVGTGNVAVRTVKKPIAAMPRGGRRGRRAIVAVRREEPGAGACSARLCVRRREG
jgi:hypothetical protein